jgi:hypothetical protein
MALSAPEVHQINRHKPVKKCFPSYVPAGARAHSPIAK